jgi:hypothetical protein
LVVLVLFVREIVDQLRSGKFRPRGSSDYKTRKNNPVWFWSSIGAQVVVILLWLCLFSQAVLKASK